MVVSILLWVLAVVLVVVGIAGVIAPVLPGSPVVFVGLVCAAWAEHFEYVGLHTLIVLAVLVGLTYVVDGIASALGVKRVGASRRAMAGAMIGTGVGVFFGIPGILLGPFVGAVLGELWARRDVAQAGRAGVAAWIGFIIGTVSKLVIVSAMIGIFVVKRLF